MKNNKNEQQSDDGLPKIAEVIRSRRVIAIALGVVVLMMGTGFLLISRLGGAPQVAKEESYTIETEPVLDAKLIPATALTSANTILKQEVQANPEVVKAQMALVMQKQVELQQRLMAPLMAVNNNTSGQLANDGKVKADREANPNTRFLEQVSEQEVKQATATSIGSLGTIIAQGNFIHAILEPSTNSDLPGSLRAIVSEPSYSEDGSKILIPRGSRLIGEYKSGMLQGQSRIFIVWSRLITPSGISIQLGSAGVDSLGVSGIGADTIDRHFFERFGTASLLSIIGAGAANVGMSGSDDKSASSYRTALANGFSQSASESLQQDGAIAPTLKTLQGKPIMVFVAKDLQFAPVLKQTTSSISVF